MGDEIEAFLSEHRIATVILCGTDLMGKQRGKRVTASYFRDVAKRGIRIASFVNRAALLDEPLPEVLEDGVPDIVGRPDLKTLRLVAWEPGAAIVMMDWTDDEGRAHPLCVRTLLRDQAEALAQAGFVAKAAFEFEFFLVPHGDRRPGLAIGEDDEAGMPREVQCNGILEGARDEVVLSRLREALADIVEGVIPEWGHGQREANLRPADPVEAADRAVLLKLAVKAIAAREGFAATFMAKWRADRSGSSGHLHLSLKDRGGAHAFHDPQAPDRLSPVLHQWVAGQVALCRATTVFHAPYVNSYRRFRSGSFAPTGASVGLDNRTVAFRVLNYAPEATRVEHRVGGADVNPYLSLSTTLAAGRLGLTQQVEQAAFQVGDAYASGVPSLPQSLGEAAAEAEASKRLRQVLPSHVIKAFTHLVRHEAALVDREVPDTERRRYFAWA